MVLLEMGFAWAASVEGWMEQPHGVPPGRALGSWRSPSSSADPSLRACPALLGMPWGGPWQRDLRNTHGACSFRVAQGVRGVGVTLTGRRAEMPEV